MTGPLLLIGRTARERWAFLLIWGVGFAVLFQVAMLAALIGRFGALPNYAQVYDWPGNVWWIIRSTPSWRDVLRIAADEWLLEIGRMNYDYGTGISEWSLNVVPARLAVLAGMGALAALCVELSRRTQCDRASATTPRATTGAGAALVAMTNATMSWVVCCATPSWIVGLAMLGLGVSTSLALKPLGPLLSGAGFLLLAFTAVVLAWRRERRAGPEPEHEHA